jgi:ribosomal protein L25 (general stress protein Ctc)
MKKLTMVLKNQGFTITELLIAMGLTVIVGLGIFQALTNSSQMTKAFSEKMDDRVEAKLGDKLLVRDLRNAGASLNNVYAKDDHGNNFFDHDVNRSSEFYRKQNRKNRVLTLSKDGTKTFHFLAFDTLRGTGLFADAVTFFEVGAPPANPYAPASLTYKGMNYNNYLTATNSEGEPINNPLLIDPVNLDKLILVDSSSYMPTEPARPAVFIGKITKVKSIYDVLKLGDSSIPKINGTPMWNYNITTPKNTIVKPSNFEEFMYNLPPVGANGASVRIKPVRIFKYELDCVTDKTECILYRHDVLHGASSQKIPVLRGFNKIVFLRDDIATSVFKVTTEKIDTKKSTTTDELTK